MRAGQPDYFKKELWDRKKNWQPVLDKLREEIGDNFKSLLAAITSQHGGDSVEVTRFCTQVLSRVVHQENSVRTLTRRPADDYGTTPQLIHMETTPVRTRCTRPLPARKRPRRSLATCDGTLLPIGLPVSPEHVATSANSHAARGRLRAGPPLLFHRLAHR